MTETTERGGTGMAWSVVAVGSKGSCPLRPLRRLRPRRPAKRPAPSRPRRSQATDSADQVLEGFSHYVTKDGVRRSRVEADTAFFYESTQVTQLKKIRVVFFDLQGAGELDADRQDAAPIAGRTARWRPTATWSWSRPTAGGSRPRRSSTTTGPTPSRPTCTSPSTGQRAPGRQQLPLRPGLQERGHRPAAGRRGRRHPAAGAGQAEMRAGRAASSLGMRGWRPGPLAGAGAGAAAPNRPSSPRPPRRPSPAAQRCTFQIDNVDRQGAVNETPTGTNYFAGGNVRLSCRGTRSPCRATASRPTAATSSSSSAT